MFVSLFSCDEQTHILPEKDFHDSKQRLFMGLVYLSQNSKVLSGSVWTSFDLFSLDFFFVCENGIMSSNIHFRKKTSVMQKIKMYTVSPIT